jgi:uncharacterized protein (DUF58 family)
MDFKPKLNADIAGGISELQAAMKEFLLKHRLYRILLRGKGLEFETYRAFSPDDDANTIDWRASKRSNALLVKQYRDERNLKIVFIIDVGENMALGSAKKLKCEYAAEVIGAFAHLITSTGDRVGYILFNDKVRNFARPSGGDRHFHRFMDELTNPAMYIGATDLNKGLGFALDYLKTNIDSVIIFSDFISFNESTRRNLSLISKRFETVAVSVRDRLDYTFPDFTGEVVIEDPSTKQQLLVNPSVVKEAYEKIALIREKELREACLKFNIDLLELSTEEPFVPFLAEFLKGRMKRKEGIGAK